MALLVAFAVLAGAGTALTPCVLPVLPALLSASATGGRRRPLGVILGLTVTHVIAIVGIASVIDGVGLAGGVTRTLAICALLLFGAGAPVARLGEVVERPFARLTRFGPSSAGSGFWSGVLVGGAARLPLRAVRGPDPRGGDLGGAPPAARRASSWPWRSATGSGPRWCCWRSPTAAGT